MPAQLIGETFWQVTSIRASPLAPMVTVRGPRIIRGTSTDVGFAVGRRCGVGVG